MACSRTWQEKYAESHEEISANQQQLAVAFGSYHAADLRNKTIKKIHDVKDSKNKKRTASLPALLVVMTAFILGLGVFFFFGS